jgi:hypothetical protein
VIVITILVLLGAVPLGFFKSDVLPSAHAMVME